MGRQDHLRASAASVSTLDGREPAGPCVAGAPADEASDGTTIIRGRRPAEVVADAAEPPRRRRFSLAAKLATAAAVLVSVILLINGVGAVWLSYRDAERAALQRHLADARLAAERLAALATRVESQLGWMMRTDWGARPADQQRADLYRLLALMPEVASVAFIDRSGREQIRVARGAADRVGSGLDLSAEPAFKAGPERASFGLSRPASGEPVLAVALAQAAAPASGAAAGPARGGVMVAELVPGALRDILAPFRPAEGGAAYLVTEAGQLAAAVPETGAAAARDLAGLGPVVDASAPGQGPGGAGRYPEGFGGRPALVAHAPVPRLGWRVLVESPAAHTLAAIWPTLVRNAALLLFGLLLAVLAATVLARRLFEPMRRLQRGMERVGRGDLSQRVDIRSRDEIESLATRFNAMAGRLQEGHAALEGKVAERTREVTLSLEQQAATAEVLEVISRSGSDLDTILRTLAETASRLCGAGPSQIFRRDGDVYRHWVSQEVSEAYRDLEELEVIAPGRGTLVGRVALERRAVHIVDCLADPDYEMKETARIGGLRTILGVPLLSRGEPIGAFALARLKVEPFTSRQIKLLTIFADQAVIAIENARLFAEVEARTRELDEALKQQTATADVLKVISRSAFDLGPVLDTLIQSAAALCSARRGMIFLRDGDLYRLGAWFGLSLEMAQYFREHPRRAGRESVVPRVVQSGTVEQIPDFEADPEFSLPDRPQSDSRAALGVPLSRNGQVEGVFVLIRPEPGLFNDRQVELVQTFADQALIAIENVRLFEEVRARTGELSEALEFQTAMSDVLNVISRSPNDLQPVLDTIVATAQELCHSDYALVFRLRADGLYHLAASRHADAPFLDWLLAHPIAAGDGTATGLAARDGTTVHLHDALADPRFTDFRRQQRSGSRTQLSVPLMRGAAVIGVVFLGRREVKPFTERQVDLVQTFADQAVIAIENVRLFEEVQARTGELQESLDYQTATGEVLSVISRSPSEIQPVLDAIVQTAARLCAAEYAFIVRPLDDRLHLVAGNDVQAGHIAFLAENPVVMDRTSVTGRVALDRAPVHVTDVLADPEFDQRQWQEVGQQRTVLGVPLLREGELRGVMILARTRVQPFSPKQVDLVTTFADQAVIAINNVALFDEVQARTRELQQSLDDLRTAQGRLIQTEKLASLGQLTAGIAHEIKNPLNFVNNFAALSTDLIAELREILAETELPGAVRADVDELAEMLRGNLEKVVSHGRRADSIVKNMLLHSREGSGDHRPIDLNGLVEESLNLAYHGARAERPGFNVTLERSLDPAVGQVDLYPQEITRVLLNLITNGFYASAKRKEAGREPGYEPMLRVTTRDVGEAIEIRVRDNGTGIPDEVRAKIFNPFFTTKPAGEGTGLGLSLSHDIVVKQHGGTLAVDTAAGQFTEFTVVLPRDGLARGVVAESGAAA